MDRVIRVIRERRGPECARHSKIVMSGMFGLAVRHDVLDANPVRELSPSPKKKQSRTVELTEESLAGLREYLRASPDAQKHDLIDLVDVLSGLGCRIGELLALDWTKVDAEAGTQHRGNGDPGAGGGADRSAAHKVHGGHAHDPSSALGTGLVPAQAR